MKKFATIAGMGLLMWVMFTGCDSKRKPGKIYMPDMAYSRSYETYAEHDSSIITNDPADKGGNKIFYNSQPVAGTIKRGELFPYTLPNDTNGYKMSATVMNPITEMTKAEMDETARLFNINCAICHGEKGLGNGPISTSGKIGGIANLTLQQYIDMADGTMFHSLTYGRNLMGSYASQLDRKQRWMLVKYIRSLQPKPTVEAATAVAKADTTAVAVKK
jgi:mono/diheme cytochrome c family protein